jgi:hypothetical protein
MLLAATFVVLVVCALMRNLNHGGTVGPSRYGVWLLPVLTPFLGTYLGEAGWRRTWFNVVVVASMCWSLWVLPPRLKENSSQASRFAVWVTDHVPRLFDSLPEVFGERFGNIDGQVSLPVASPACGKVLLAGTGSRDLRWPIPCVPRQLPEECSPVGVLCYANRGSVDGYTFSRAPAQPSFGFTDDADLTWSGPGDFRWLPVQPRWARLSRVSPMSTESFVRNATGIRRIREFQHPGEMIAFTELLPLASRGTAIPALLLAPTSERGSTLWILDADAHRPLATQSVGVATWVTLPLVEMPGSLVLLLVDASRQ